MPRYDIITFDCYGTLIDWENGIADAFLAAASADGIDLDRAAVLHAYAATERVVEQEYRPYRDVLAETAMRVAHALGWPLARERAGFLAASLPSWKPFADTNASLRRLRDAGVSLGILSNIDDDLLAATRRHFESGFDLIVTAQQVRSYKPGYAHFLAARETIGDARWLHAAESNFHDIVPTNALGIDNAWINRTHAAQLPAGAPALGEFADLATFADVIVA